MLVEPIPVPYLCWFNNLHFSGKAFLYILRCVCADTLIQSLLYYYTVYYNSVITRNRVKLAFFLCFLTQNEWMNIHAHSVQYINVSELKSSKYGDTLQFPVTSTLSYRSSDTLFSVDLYINSKNPVADKHCGIFVWLFWYSAKCRREVSSCAFLCELFAEGDFLCMCRRIHTWPYPSPFTPHPLPSSLPLGPVNECSFAS